MKCLVSVPTTAMLTQFQSYEISLNIQKKINKENVACIYNEIIATHKELNYVVHILVKTTGDNDYIY